MSQTETPNHEKFDLDMAMGGGGVANVKKKTRYLEKSADVNLKLS